jgi:hypothetical protein
MESNDEQCEDDYVDGTDEEDFDENMMETMFELSAYVSSNDENNDNNEDGSDDDENNNDNTNPARRNQQTGWTYLTPGDLREHPVVTISIDGVDQRLLVKAREEVPAVLNNIKAKLFGKRSRDMSKVSPADFLKAFMDPQLLGYMKAFINSNGNSSNPVSTTEIMSFVRVELMLSFYKVCSDIAL